MHKFYLQNSHVCLSLFIFFIVLFSEHTQLLSFIHINIFSLFTLFILRITWISMHSTLSISKSTIYQTSRFNQISHLFILLWWAYHESFLFNQSSVKRTFAFAQFFFSPTRPKYIDVTNKTWTKLSFTEGRKNNVLKLTALEFLLC